MLNSGRGIGGKDPVDGVKLIGDMVERTTCSTSLALSGPFIWCAFAASSPALTTIAATPAVVGVPVEVEPSSLGTLNSECGPYEVSDERERKVVAVRSPGHEVPERFD